MGLAKLKKSAADLRQLEIVTISPERALELLEHNTLNRPLSQPHVNRLVAQIKGGHWRFNGDTIKIADSGKVLDGQHRLWAIIESKIAVESAVVYGVTEDAFGTVDTLRKPRGGADILAIDGLDDMRRETAAALTLLIRWQRKKYAGPLARVENEEIRRAFRAHPKMVEAARRARKAVPGIGSPSTWAFIYYVFGLRNGGIADTMIEALEDPGNRRVDDPFFRLRQIVIGKNRSNQLTAWAAFSMAIKAANAYSRGERIKVLTWRGDEAIPEMKF